MTLILLFFLGKKHEKYIFFRRLFPSRFNFLSTSEYSTLFFDAIIKILCYGMVVHLFPSYKFPEFSEFPMPAMLTSSMEEVLLQSKVTAIFYKQGQKNDF